MTSLFPDGDLNDAVELGAIDERSARVWVRFAGRERVSATLDSADERLATASIDLSDERDWTGVLELAAPKAMPGAPFTVTVEGRRRSGRFAPAPGSPAALTFGFGSCHMPYEEAGDGTIAVRSAEAAIYPAMMRDLQRASGQLVLLVGDQIYADGLEPFSVREGNPGEATDSALLSRYRTVYRGFFNQRGIRQLREAFPTLCIWDDHDIFDNWGSTAEKSATDRRLFAAACRSYVDYQHLRNPGGGHQGPTFQWIHRWGDIAIVALDVRGARDYESGTMLGADQWEWFQSWLASDDAREVATLFIASSVPVIHSARWFTRLFDLVPKRFAESIRDRWNSTGFIASRNRLLDALFAWQAGNRARQVVILSGDVHCASAFTVRQRHDSGILHQITSSAMTTSLVMDQIIFNRTVVHGTNLLEDHYHFERHFLSLTNNYCGIRVEPIASGGHRIVAAIRSWDVKKQRLRTTGKLLLQADG